ncbi:MAG TPA: cation:proton antiporter [Pseudonocardiaceae bacterium]
MIPTVLAAAVAGLTRCLAALRLQRWNLGAPVVMVLAGILVGLGIENAVLVALGDTEVTQHVAEIILAFLLFVDATEVRRGRLWGNSPTLVVRVLLLAFPVSIGVAMLLGVALFGTGTPHLSWPVLLIIACIVVPTDFAPNEQIVRDRRLSARVRSVLNVESGYNDGITSPIFLFALLLASKTGAARTPLDAFIEAVEQAAKAIGVGVVLGVVVAWLLYRSDRRGWMTAQSRRIVVLLTPLVAYSAAVEIGGNGFVTSFVCGVAFRYAYRLLVARGLRRTPSSDRRQTVTALTRDFVLVEDVTAVMTMTMWFVVGLATVVVIGEVDWQAIVFCLAALTVVRVVPVLASLIGSTFSWRDRLLIGLLGPRGTPTIVFGLIAFNALPDNPAGIVLETTVLCVLGSVLLQGAGSDPIIRSLRARSDT